MTQPSIRCYVRPNPKPWHLGWREKVVTILVDILAAAIIVLVVGLALCGWWNGY